MPVQSGIQTGLQSIQATFSASDAGEKWADAIASGFSGLVPSSTTVSTAKTVLQTALTAAFQDLNGGCITKMEAAMAAFGATVATGMLPTYTGVPPAGPVGFASVFTSPVNNNSWCAQVATKIQQWVTTGTATLVAPPNTVIPWS